MKRIGTRAYIKTLIKDPSVASITPTSNFGIKKLISTINFDQPNFFIEYGPGGGVITKELLRRMTPDSQILAIERNDNFANSLNSAIKDERLTIACDSAENVNTIIKDLRSKNILKYEKANYILSGIPFSMFPVELKNKILDETRVALNNDGSFLVYQFLISLSGGKNDIKRKMRKFFDVTRSEVELRNVPPLRIFEGNPKQNVLSSVAPKN